MPPPLSVLCCVDLLDSVLEQDTRVLERHGRGVEVRPLENPSAGGTHVLVSDPVHSLCRIPEHGLLDRVTERGDLLANRWRHVDETGLLAPHEGRGAG